VEELAGPRRPPLVVVEDNDEDFEIFSWALQDRLPVPLVRCVDGDDLLDYLHGRGAYAKQKPLPPALILLDLNLPGLDGREVLALIKSDDAFRKIPVVVFTTSDNPRDVAICYRQGASGYIVKGLDVKRLITSLQNFRAYWFDTVLLPTVGV
jgi:CheY-like chemotaxis protein